MTQERSVSDITDLVEKELQTVGVAFDDGFDLIDVSAAIEACAKVVNATHAEWSTLDPKERKNLVLDLVKIVDERHCLAEKLAKKIVAWDIPYAPDSVIDAVLNEERIAEWIRFAAEEAVSKVVERMIGRERAIGPRAFALASDL